MFPLGFMLLDMPVFGELPAINLLPNDLPLFRFIVCCGILLGPDRSSAGFWTLFQKLAMFDSNVFILLLVSLLMFSADWINALAISCHEALMLLMFFVVWSCIFLRLLRVVFVIFA